MRAAIVLKRLSDATARLLDEPRFWWAFIVTTVLALFFPPDSAVVRHWDFLDSYVAYQHMRPPMFESLFRFDVVIERVANGLPLNHLGLGELSFPSLCHSLLPGFAGTAVMVGAQVLLLFYATFGVIRWALPRSQTRRTVIAGAVAFYIAFLPISPVVVGGVIGANLTLLGILKVRSGALRGGALCILLSPFIAQSPFGPVFYLPAYLLLAALWLRGRTRLHALGLLGLAGALTLLVDYRLYFAKLLDAEPTHRVLWLEGRTGAFAGLLHVDTWRAAAQASVRFFRSGQGHYRWNPDSYLILACVLSGVIAFVVVFLRRTEKGARLSRLRSELRPTTTMGLLTGAFLTLLLICIVTGALEARVVDLQKLTGQTLQFQRGAMVFSFIAAALTMAAGFALSVNALRSTSLAAIMGALVFALAVPASSDHARLKLQNLLHDATHGFDDPHPPHRTIRGYYRPALFDALKSHLGPSWASERVVSVGIDPMIASVNGFAHLDGYFQQYPLSYKLAFREVIAPELAIDATKRAYFDDWGSRVYVFAERTQGRKQLLNIDGCALAALGGTLLLSQLELANPAASDLKASGRVEGVTGRHTDALFLYRPGACPREASR